MTDRTLLLARHATTASFAPGGDRSRPLLPTGHQQARDAGEWLRETGRVPDLALVSSTVRTQQTWEGIVAGLGSEAPQQRTEDRIYENDTSSLLAVIADSPDDAATLLLIGHAPAVPALAYDLTDSGAAETDRDALLELPQRYEPMTIATLTIADLDSWSDLVPGTAILRSTHRL